ncbi:hypothetical protein ACFQ4C_08895 [Larkinella insperata]|uniref:Uncharacterized protein n=1 Tax=Larkinella insperata TaxID=332158 RepID=A0ABW3QHC0_9BACT
MKQEIPPRWSVVVLNPSKAVVTQIGCSTLVEAVHQQAVHVINGAFRVTVYDTTTKIPHIVLHSNRI